MKTHIHTRTHKRVVLLFHGPELCKQEMAGREKTRALLPRARRLVLMRTEGCQERAWRKTESGVESTKRAWGGKRERRGGVEREVERERERYRERWV